MIRRSMAIAVAIVATIGGVVAPAEAGEPRPGPTGLESPWRPVTPPGQVWIDAEAGLGWAAGQYAAAFWNQRTQRTDFVCADPDCTPTPCPPGGVVGRGSCLMIRWGVLPTGQYAKYEPLYCLASCVKAGLITIHPYSPVWGYDWSPDKPGVTFLNPWNRATLITHMVGHFIGLPVNTESGCSSVMSPSSWMCAPPRPGEAWLTPVELAHVEAW